MKQKYLMENVINCGYDPTEFAQFMEYKFGKKRALLDFPRHSTILFDGRQLF